MVKTLLLPISPAKKRAITPPVCLAATGTYTWFMIFPLQSSRFRLETQLVKSTGEINVKQSSPTALPCGQRERQPGALSRYLVSFIRASYGKSFLGPWAEAKPASSPVSWHYAIITDGKQRRQQRDM